MRLLLFAISIMFFPIDAPPTNQDSANSDACKFELSTSSGKPSVTGPDEVVQLVRVLDQPDSPVELTAIDFKDSWISIYDGRFTKRLRCTMKLRNRSDQLIHAVEVEFGGTVGGSGAHTKMAIPPGQEVEIKGCGVGGTGAIGSRTPQILVTVKWVSVGACDYLPSVRIPHESRVGFRRYWIY